MLVLSRHKDETIIIGDNIEVTVVDIKGDQVRLGIVAPRDVAVHRKEVYEAIQKENISAAKLGGMDLGKLGKLFPNVKPKKDSDEKNKPEK